MPYLYLKYTSNILWKYTFSIYEVHFSKGVPKKGGFPRKGVFQPQRKLCDIYSDDPENTVSSKYYDIEELQNLITTNKSKSLSLFYINACSLNENQS